MPLEIMIKVSLTYAEELEAHQAGFERAKALKATANHASRYDKGLNYHSFIAQLAEAVGSEIAVARYFGLFDFMPTHNTFKRQADVAQRIEVKWTRWKDGHLVVHKSDRDTDIAVLVVGQSPDYYLAGWLPVESAKSKRYWVESERNWWVGQSNLNPMEDFLESKYADISL
jgi:hypothetical protein